MNFRTATTADVRLLAEMNARLIRDERHRNRKTIDQLHARMARWLAGPYTATVFERDAETIGYALHRPDGPTLLVRHFYIEPTHRRRGYGRRAFNHLIDHVAGESKRVRVEVLCQNEAALAFYRSIGFADYCLVMERDL